MSYIAVQKIESVIRWRSYLADPNKVWIREKDKKRIQTQLSRLEAMLPELIKMAKKYRGQRVDVTELLSKL